MCRLEAFGVFSVARPSGYVVVGLRSLGLRDKVDTEPKAEECLHNLTSTPASWSKLHLQLEPCSVVLVRVAPLVFRSSKNSEF